MKIQPANATQGLVVLLALTMFIPFQNCSKVGVSDVKQPAISQTGSPGTTDSQGNPADPSNPSNPSDPSDPSNPPGSQLNPQIDIAANTTVIKEGSNSTLTITYTDVETVSYLCMDRATQAIVQSGAIGHSGQTVQIAIDRDLQCEAVGHPIGSSTTIHDTVDLMVDCANRVKNTAANRCEDFTCKTVTALDKSQLLNIPARTSDGICYAAKIMDAIPNGASSLTKAIDQDVMARNHDVSGFNENHHPYQMGISQPEISILGPRVVKLAGGMDPSAKILVDNFILMGIYPSNQDVSQSLQSYYQVMGTSDATYLDANGADTHAISFLGTLIPLISYASGGTSSVSAVDVTRSIQPNIIHKLDVRALDCGGHRELSDIYILFQ